MKTLVLIGSLTFVIIASVVIVAGQQRSATGAASRGTAAVGANGADWPTFGGDNTRTNGNMAPTRITAANVGTMVRQEVTISAPIDAGLIYLRGVQVNGGSHDTLFGRGLGLSDVFQVASQGCLELPGREATGRSCGAHRDLDRECACRER